MPGRAQSASESRSRDEGVARETVRAATGQEARRDGAVLRRERRHCVRSSDPLLRLATLSHGQRFADGLRNERYERRAEWRPGWFHHGMVEGWLSVKAGSSEGFGLGSWFGIRDSWFVIRNEHPRQDRGGETT